jgi:hypothetical protein
MNSSSLRAIIMTRARFNPSFSFGVDFDRDLVAVVEGVPKSRPSLGSLVRGSTSIWSSPHKISVSVTGFGHNQFFASFWKS